MEYTMRIVKFIVTGLLCVGLDGLALHGQAPSGPLSQFRGNYQIANGGGTVRIADALGGSYTEFAVTLVQPAHELKMLVGAPTSNGMFQVWRFEQEPAPAVSNAGTARLEGQELIADFPHVAGPAGKLIRERWRLTNGALEFTLEASGGNGPPVRAGGYTATRQ
jgi:hypothetical protein